MPVFDVFDLLVLSGKSVFGWRYVVSKRYRQTLQQRWASESARSVQAQKIELVGLFIIVNLAVLGLVLKLVFGWW